MRERGARGERVWESEKKKNKIHLNKPNPKHASSKRRRRGARGGEPRGSG